MCCQQHSKSVQSNLAHRTGHIWRRKHLQLEQSWLS